LLLARHGALVADLGGGQARAVRHLRHDDHGDAGDEEDDAIAARQIFSCGDKIKVIDGQLKGMIGFVRKILEYGKLMVDPQDLPGGHNQGLIICDPLASMKHFESGNRVKVIRGAKTGEIGSVLTVDEDSGMAQIASDFNNVSGWPVTFSCVVNDLKHTSERATVSAGDAETDETNLLPMFQLGSLVETTFGKGVICHVERGLARVLTANGRRADYNLSDIVVLEEAPILQTRMKNMLPPMDGKSAHSDHHNHKIDWSRDKNHQLLYRRTEIFIPPLAEQHSATAKILHMADNMLFSADKNGNYYVCRGDQCIRTENEHNNSSQAQLKDSSGQLALTGDSQPAQLALTAGGAQGSGNIGNGAIVPFAQGSAAPSGQKVFVKWEMLGGKTEKDKKRNREKYQGLRFKILKGAYKGQVAEFRQYINDFELRVALSIKAKMIVVKKDWLKIIDAHKAKEIEEKIDLDGEFKPGIVNSVVFLVSCVQQVAVFVVNLQGRPFMTGLTENRPLLYSLIATFILTFMFASETVPSLNKYMQLVPFPSDDFRNFILILLAADVFL